jgi:hypothetical protein
MAFKFSIGHIVECKPAGQPAGLFKIIRHMPQEDNTSDRKYRIKSLKEGFDRNEADLSPADLREGAYPESAKPPRAGGGRAKGLCFLRRAA